MKTTATHAIALIAGVIALPLISRAAENPASDMAPAAADSIQQLQQQLQSEQQQLQQQLQALQQQQAHIHALEERLEAVETARASSLSAPAPQAATPSALQPAPGTLAGSFGPEGYALRSADGANEVRLRGNVSVDGRYFTDSATPASADTWLIRRLRPIVEGTLSNDFDYRFMPDFAQGKTLLQDAWGDVRIAPSLIIQFGKFKAPVGLERLQLEQFARFIEVSLPSDLLPYRDLGLKVGGSLGGGVLTYDAGVLDGTLDGGSTDANPIPDQNSTGKFTSDGRLFSRPFLHSGISGLEGLGLGVAGTYSTATGVATPASAALPAVTTALLASYKTPGQQSLFGYRGDTVTAGAFNNATVADGLERRVVPQLYYYYRAFSLLGEYVNEDQRVVRHVSSALTRSATLNNTAWQVQGAWFLTGEDESYDSATPRRNFNFGRGGPGAWELVARYHEIRFDPEAFSGGGLSFANPASAALAARALGTGLNWYLNPNFKVQLDYEVTRFEGGALDGNRPDERLLTSQFAIIY